MTKEYDCEHCEHWVKDSFGDRVCEFDGECECFEITNEDCVRACKTQDELAKLLVGLCDRAIQSRFGGVNFTTDVELVKEWLQKPHEVDDEMES